MPDTLLRWHRQLIARKWKYAPRPRRRGVLLEIRQIIVRMATDNPTWGYTRIQGALTNVGHRVGRSTIRRILKAAGLPPVPRRPTSWQTFLRSHWGAITGADFFTTEVWTWRGLVTYYTVFVIDLASRKLVTHCTRGVDHILGVVHVKDLLRLIVAGVPLSAAEARPMPIVPEPHRAIRCCRRCAPNEHRPARVGDAVTFGGYRFEVAALHGMGVAECIVQPPVAHPTEADHSGQNTWLRANPVTWFAGCIRCSIWSRRACRNDDGPNGRWPLPYSRTAGSRPAPVR
jgi:hypothetical protein